MINLNFNSNCPFCNNKLTIYNTPNFNARSSSLLKINIGDSFQDYKCHNCAIINNSKISLSYKSNILWFINITPTLNSRSSLHIKIDFNHNSINYINKSANLMEGYFPLQDFDSFPDLLDITNVYQLFK